MTRRAHVSDETRLRAAEQRLPALATRMVWSLDAQLRADLRAALALPTVMAKLADALRAELRCLPTGDALDAG